MAMYISYMVKIKYKIDVCYPFMRRLPGRTNGLDIVLVSTNL